MGDYLKVFGCFRRFAISVLVSLPLPAEASRHPFVDISAPADGESFLLGEPIVVGVEALSGHESVLIKEVGLFLDGTEIGRLSQEPYQFTVTPELGEHKIQAFAKDSENQPGESDSVFFDVIAASEGSESASSTGSVTSSGDDSTTGLDSATSGSTSTWSTGTTSSDSQSSVSSGTAGTPESTTAEDLEDSTFEEPGDARGCTLAANQTSLFGLCLWLLMGGKVRRRARLQNA